MVNILLILGARPQIIKAGPVIFKVAEYSSIILRVIHTGQHYDYEMSRIFFEQMRLPDPYVNLEIGSGSHGWQTGQMLIELEKVLQQLKPDLVLVPGDTNSTLAGALAATKMGIPVAHMEAGARSGDMRMPEEVNRRLTDHCSTLLFTVSEACTENLLSEGISRDGIFQTGDTMYDVLLMEMPRIESSDILRKLGLEKKSYALATCHRQENVEDTENLKQITQALAALDEVPIVLPLHPRTRKKLTETGLMAKLQKAKHLRILEPLGHIETLSLVKNAKALLTDSGGMQKEAYWLRTPCITLRTTTEWTETLEGGANRLAPPREEKIRQAYRTVMNGINPEAFEANPYGDGNAAERILKSIRENSSTP